MNPDGSGCNIQLVNATGLDMVIGTSPTNAAQNFGSYQMAAWFPGLGFGSILAPAGKTGTSFAQALRGVGDQDDSANCPVNMAQANDPSWSLFQWFASSASNSAHFMYITGSPGSSLPAPYLVLGIANSTFETTAPAQVRWYQLGTETIQLGFPPSLSVTLVDLEKVFDSVTAKDFYGFIGASTLSPQQRTKLYAQVIGLVYPDLTTLGFQLSNVSFPNPPPPSQSTQSVIQSTTVTLQTPGSYSHAVNFSNQFDNSMTMTSTTAWTVGAEVAFSLPLPLSPSAKISGSFEFDGEERADASESTTISVTDTVELQGPGTFVITGYVNFADDYKATFTGHLLVTGTIAVPAANLAVQPLTGSTLWNLMVNPERNEGSQAQPFTIGPNNVTASVSGTIEGTMAYQTSINVAPAAG